MQVVAAEGRGAGGKSVGAPAYWALGWHTEAVERAKTAIVCDVNKPVKYSLHSKRCDNLKILLWILQYH